MSTFQKGFAHLFILFAIVVVGFGAVGYFAYESGKSKKELNNGLTETPILAPTNSPNVVSKVLTPTSDLTVNWKTYTNNKYGFTFKYPSNLDSTEGLISGPYTGNSVPIQTFSDSTTLREGTDAPFDGFSLYVLTNPNSTFKEYVENELKIANLSEYGGYGEKILTHGFAGSSISVTPNITYYYRPSSNENTIVVLSMSKTSSSSLFVEKFDQILSTFKFTK